MVWYRWHVPIWSFILWLAVLGRLNTKDRLRAWGLLSDSSCVLCYGGSESHSHLFFDCSFTSLIWKNVKTKCGLGVPACGLETELHWGYLNDWIGKNWEWNEFKAGKTTRYSVLSSSLPSYIFL